MAKNTSKEEIAKKIKEAKASFSSKGSKEEIAKEIKEASKQIKGEIKEEKIESKPDQKNEDTEELQDKLAQERSKIARLSLEEELSLRKDRLDLDSLAYKNYPNSASEVPEIHQKPENLASVLDEVAYLRGEIDEKPFEYIAEMKEPNESLYSHLTGTIQEEMTKEMGVTTLYQNKEEDEGNKLYFTS